MSFAPVPCGCEIILAPDGTTQLYELVLATLLIVYVASVEEPINRQALDGPDIAPGAEGMDADNINERSPLFEQPDMDLTFIVLFVLATKPALNVTLMLVESGEADIIVAVGGNVHLYVIALDTGAIL